ncbi:ABC transporter substrate-binding protein [Methanoregula formicica]|uniref:ABC-type Fe3+-hydroxamate transport system, periplasmic component n=1 Tax=Methanoregula formicica (strain DSM 22288 / NBRC 105244 / SMSP) TaxID=593750 RepID=L0HD47_METFS|nr:ABC transporter substrate-binding protein [Methanoregula formicica]AGB01955.1 ABC-type Fe3+-hydroxamate transport system, periplasmic component [Methanoregula formicica SMSP]
MTEKEKWHLPMVFLCALGSLLLLFILITGCSSLSPTVASTTTDTTNSTNISVTDYYGNTISLSQPARRIICFNEQAAEILAAIGAGDQIIGVSQSFVNESFIMNQAPNAVSVGNYWTPDVEKIITLHPDLLISAGKPGSPPQSINKVVAANITVLYLNCYNIQDLANDTRKLSRITGHEERAEKYAQFSERYLSLVKSRLANISDNHQPGPRVYFESWYDYTLSTPDTFVNDLLTIVHARNIAENITQSSATVSPEWVINQNPDVIIKIVTYDMNLTAVHEEIMNRPGLSEVRAVQDNRVYVLHWDMVASPRAAAGLVYVAKALYPDLFRDISPNDILNEYKMEFLREYDARDAFYPRL